MRAILIVDHGSRASAANAQLVELSQLVRRELMRRGDSTIVAHAHLELGTPAIPEAITKLIAQGAQEIVVHPYFLAKGHHASVDVPRIVYDAARAHPEVRVRITEPIGVHPLMADLVIQRCEE